MSEAPHEAPIAGLDPGRSKCGLVLADPAKSVVLEAAILVPDACQALLQSWREQGLRTVLLGSGTGSGSWRPRLAALGLERIPVNEYGSTLAARQRYWQLFPPGLAMRLLPAGLRLPPRDLDDVVAQVLVEHHYGQLLRRTSANVRRHWPS
jgi:hypothetical protein